MARKTPNHPLHESGELYRTLADAAQDIIYIIDRDDRVTFLNKFGLDLLGIQGRDVIGRPRHELFPPAEAERQYQSIRRVFTTGEPLRIESTVPLPGRMTWQDTLLVPLRTDGGEVTAVMGLSRDVTARHQAEDALRKSEERYRNIFETLEDLYYQTDKDGIITHLSPSLTRLTGFVPEELIGKPTSVVYESPQDREILRSKLVTEGYVRDFELRLLKRDGTAIPVSLTANRLLDTNGGLIGMSGILRDITARKQAEERLRSSEQKFSTLFAANPVTLTLVSPLDGTFVDVNDAFVRHTGFSRDEVIGKTAAELGIFPDPVAYKTMGAHLRRDHTISGWQIRTRDKEGRIYTCQFTSRIFHMEGRPYILSTIEDITERTKAQDALRESETLLREVVSNANDEIFLLERTPDGPGRYILVNDKAVRMLGYSSEELLQMSPRDIVPAEIQQQVMPDIIRRLRQEGHATFESIHKRKDGTTYPVEVSTHTFRYKGMDVDLSICRDITGRRQAEQVLRESEERYRALVDHALDPILIFDFTGTILFANNAAAALGDAPDPASFLGRNVMEFIAPESREAVRADFASVREGNDAYLTQYKVITATGRELWVESMGKRIRYNGQWADIVTLRDITERRNAEDALRLANRKLTLLSGITRHDIRNQLLSLNAYLALSQDNVADPEKMAGFVRVEREITRTIEQQVLFSREYEMLGVNAPEWLEIRTITREASARMDLTGIALDLSRLQDVEVYADGLFRNAIQNLIDNSLRHGGESLHAIRFASGETGRGLVITCEDDGAGVAPDDKRMIFERGFGRNTGFGLFFIREILAITGITITENGEQGRGARFEILVPRGGYRFRKAGDGDT